MKIPESVRDSLVKKVFDMADAEGYLTNNRAENARFMDRLVAHPEVGGILLKFMEEKRVRTYVKDAILNQYTKAKRALADESLQKSISDFYKEDCVYLGKKNDVYLYRMTKSNSTLYAARGTFVKWESALRKILLHISALPEREFRKVKRMLVITTGGVPVPAGDEEILRRALSLIETDILIL
jgi:hypothetical protein